MCVGYDNDNVINWFDENHMKVNLDKFQYIIFGKYDPADNIIMEGGGGV